MEFGFEPVCDQLRTSFEPASIMEFRFNYYRHSVCLSFHLSVILAYSCSLCHYDETYSEIVFANCYCTILVLNSLASRVQHVSDLHPKFALRLTSNLRRLTVGEDRKRQKIEETTGQKYNVRICYAGRP